MLQEVIPFDSLQADKQKTMYSFLPTLIVAAVLLVQSALSCSCPEEQASKDRLPVILDSYLAKEDIYIGEVLEGSCKCLPSEHAFRSMKCVRLLKPDNDTNVVIERKQYDCSRDPRSYFTFMHLRKYTCDSVFQMAFGTNADYATDDSSSAELVKRCTFRGNGENRAHEECNSSRQPCTYKLLVKEVIKGNLMPGDVVYSNGPTVLPTLCGPPKVLEIGQTYVAGIEGSFCNDYYGWSEESSYNEMEMALLKLMSVLGTQKKL